MTNQTTGKSFVEMGNELLDVLPHLYMHDNAGELVKASSSVVNMMRGASKGYTNISGMLELYNKYCLGTSELYTRLTDEDHRQYGILIDKEKALVVALSKRDSTVVDCRIFNMYFNEYLEPMRKMDSDFPLSKNVLGCIRRINAIHALQKVLDTLIREVTSYEEAV